MKQLCTMVSLLLALQVFAQKKPLDHSVYDQWKSIGERMVSNDGQYVVYTVQPQEGDGELVIQHPVNRYRKVIPRGYNIALTEDSRFLICKIKAPFQETRQAKIRKKPASEMPKDSLAIIELGKDSVIRYPGIKSFKLPEKGAGWAAFELEKAADTPVVRVKKTTDSLKLKKDQLVKLADSVLRKAIDSIRGNISAEKLQELAEKAARQIIKAHVRDEADAEGEEGRSSGGREGSVLVVRNLYDGQEKRIAGINEYYFNKPGTRLLVDIGRNTKDSNSRAVVLLYALPSLETDSVMTGFNDAKNFVFDEAGSQLAFLAERDSSEKALQKFYRLWYYTTGMDSARLLADRNTVGMQIGFAVSEHGQLQFSKDGSRLFFGTAPVRPPRDTSLVEFETAKLDIWHYRDDYLQTQQLKNLDAELKRSYTAVYHLATSQLVQLGAEDAENITLADEGNAGWVLAETNRNYRLPVQWEGRSRWDAYSIHTGTGKRTMVYSGLYANARPSPGGKFVYWYNPVLQHWFTWEVATGATRKVTANIPVPLYNEENDVPDFPGAYGIMGWSEADSVMYVYDRYDIWRVSPTSGFAPRLLSLTLQPDKQPLTGRARKVVTRFISTDREQRFFEAGKNYLFSVFDDVTKESGLYFSAVEGHLSRSYINFSSRVSPARYAVSRNGNSFVCSFESYTACPDLYFTSLLPQSRKINFDASGHFEYYSYPEALRLSDINPQQKEYNWGTASLFRWKAYDGKQAAGILYKPEDYDPAKKYPLICYFYEQLTDGLYNYIPPAPTPSRLNIPFFVSRGYLVLAPDIIYQNGHPGNSAYNYVVSGARALVKAGMADSTRIGIQGQSWGGYQVVQLITRTHLFKAAWAGAPVANMTSAYGGIRWESGLNRQFQYEKQQSRIGASLWEQPGLYIGNSPLFHLPKVNTPLVIMHNDADGAVPWYQGIELFTGLRRLGKPVLMLNYNGEQHNLVERRNRKDIQIREQQFFDWLLKGEAPAKWLTEGVPATEKGKDWGLEPDRE